MIAKNPPPPGLRIGISWLVWQLSFGFLFVITATSAIGWHLNQLLWDIFGVPGNLYGFQNLWVHRLLIYLAISTPTALMGLLVYHRLCLGLSQINLRTVFVANTIIGTLIVLARVSSVDDAFGKWKAACFVLLLVVLSVYLCWRLAVMSPVTTSTKMLTEESGADGRPT